MDIQNESKIDYMLRYYRLIGDLKDGVSGAKSIDEALKSGIGLITELCKADAAVVWYTQNGSGTLRPFYWIGNLDFTSAVCRFGQGSVGRAAESKTAERLLTYTKGTDPETDACFENENVSSMVCVPFSSISQDLGCIQFCRTDGGTFTEEDADICEIFSSFLELQIDSDERFRPEEKPANVILSARGIEKEYVNGEITTKVLKGVNLDVHEGEFLAVLGESGCGKSTFLNILGGMDQPDSGELVFFGKDYSHATQDELTEYRRMNIGFIFQSYNLMPNLNAQQNLELIGELVEDPLDSKEALELVGPVRQI